MDAIYRVRPVRTENLIDKSENRFSIRGITAAAAAATRFLTEYLASSTILWRWKPLRHGRRRHRRHERLTGRKWQDFQKIVYEIEEISEIYLMISFNFFNIFNEFIICNERCNI
jgi:hypothetical protein